MTRPFALALLASTSLVSAARAVELPAGGQVAAGSASIAAASPSALTITQSSDRAVINWQSFSLGAGGRIDITQPGSGSALLNRVTGTATSTIAGQINANGQVYLVNPNGILITATGSVNAAGFVASTLDLSDKAFMAGEITVTGHGGSVTNRGTITIVKGGYAALIGGSVDNSGLIAAPLGRVALGTGTRATLDLTGDGFLQVAVPSAGDGGVSMSGRISADGGTVLLSAASAVNAARHTVNLSGTIEARGVSGHNGAVVLTGGDITLAGATIDVSGANGGGTVQIGGGKQGLGSLTHARFVGIDAATTIDASATAAGNGGDVVVWSDTATTFAGTILAHGVGGGSGGDAEVSSHGRLAYTGTADLTGGRFGTLLLDPYNVTISSSASSNQSGFTATGNDSVINAGVLTTALGTANVTVSTGTSGAQSARITVRAPLAWNTAATLTLQAAGAISLNAPVTAAAGGLTLTSGGAIDATGAVSVAHFALTGEWYQNSATLPGFAAGDFRITGTFLRATGGAGTVERPYLLTDIYGLQGVGSTPGLLGLSWLLANDIDASGTVNWNGGAGFAPIGIAGFGSYAHFTGYLTGAGHVVSGLVINRPSTDNVGLIGYSAGVISGVGIAGGSITGRQLVGGLVGYNAGEIAQSYATSAVNGTAYVGGLAGFSDALVSQSYATGAVSGTTYVGGLAGYNRERIELSYATGAVSGTAYVGGLAGFSDGAVTQSYATGAVSDTTYVGGLVGQNKGTLNSDYWDTTTSGRSTGVGTGVATGATGLTTAQARTSASYTGFDFKNYWYQTADLRPVLRSEAAAAVGGVISVSNLHQLQLIGANLIDSYLLTNDIDASLTSGTAAAGIFGTGGFVPVGNFTTPFKGTLAGAGHVVSGLVIARASTAYVGLIGVLGPGGNITGVGIAGGSITGQRVVGGLAGASFGPITQSYTTGAVSGEVYVGGLTGENDNTITQSYATGAVNGTTSVGGLVGNNNGTITTSYATGAVSGTTNVGGLVGFNFGRLLKNNYWDTTTSGLSTGVGTGNTNDATGLTTAQMQNVTTFKTIFAGFDFDTVWAPPSDAAHSSDNLAHYPELYALTNVIGATAGSGTRVYGNAGALSLSTYTGLHLGDFVAAHGTTIGATTTSNVGSYATLLIGVAAKTAGGASYRIVYVPGAETVTPRPITITADAKTRVYGDANPALTATVGGSGLVNGELLSGSLATTATLSTGVGATSITQGSLAASSNYSLTSFTPGTLSIRARPITVTADAKTRIYGIANPALTVTVGGSGLVNGDLLSGSLATTATLTTGVGTPSITQGSLAASSNYSLAYTPGTLSITARPITITADAKTRVYGDANPALTVTVGGSGLVNGDLLSGSLATAATLTTGVGTASITQGSLAASSNYSLTSFTPGTLSITARPITITADAKTRIYGDANPTLTVTVGGSGLVNGDLLPGNLATAATLTTGVGTASITQGSVTTGANYSLTSFTPGTLSITARPITLTADPKSRIYGDANPALTVTVGGSGLVNGDLLLGNLATAATLTTGVGTASIAQGTLTTGGNYSLTSYTPGTLSVTARPITVFANNPVRAYGDANPALTYTVGGAGLVNGDLLSGSLATAATLASNIGGYGITQGSLTTSSNYSLGYTAGSLSITARPITITADPETRIYGNVNPALTYTVGGSGLVNGDILNGSLATAATLATSVGNFSITQGTLTTGGNYSLTSYTPGTLSITARPITIIADAETRVYGNINPALTYTVGGAGLVNGDTLSGGLATAATLTSNVGGYGITQGTLAATSNYSLGYTAGSLNVTARPITVTADAETRVYGDASPALIYTVGGAGLVNGDTLSGGLATAATLASNVGGYGITQGTLAATSNYSLGYAGSTLTITARPVTVTAISGSSVYGSSPVNPGLSATNLANGETVAALTGLANSFGITSLSGVGASPYILAVAGTLTNADYSVAAATAGAWTVTPAALDVIANNAAKTYDGLAFTGGRGVTYAGLVNGETATVLSGTLVYGGTSQGAVNAGGYVIAPSGQTAANYALTYHDGALTVGQAPIIVTALSGTSVYGTTPANPGIGVSGLVNGETASILGGLANSFGITGLTTVGTGPYALSVTGVLTNADYAISSRIDGSWTVTPAALTASLISIVGKTYDGTTAANLAPGNYGLTGILNGDAVTLSGSSAGVYADRNVGTNKTVSASGLALVGAGAANYTVAASVSGAIGRIDAKSLTLAAVTDTRTYDATTASAGTATATGLVSGDTVAGLNQSFDAADAGTRTLSINGGYTIADGNGGANYAVTAQSAAGMITAKALTVSLTGIVGKTYDGTTDATLAAANYGLAGVVGTDVVTVNARGLGSYADRNAGTNKTVSVNGVGLTGTAAANYTVAATVSGAVGRIDAKSLILAAVTNTRTYDATTASAGAATVAGLVAGDTVSGLAQSFDTANAGTRTLLVNGGYTVADGNGGANYAITALSAAGAITPKALTASLTGAAVKTYDGTATATLAAANYALAGVIAGDTVTLDSPTTGAYADRHTGTAKLVTATGVGLTGAAAGNYSVASTASGSIGEIDARLLTASLVGGVTKVYDGSVSATLAASNYGLSGIVAGDAITVATTAGTFADKNVAAGKTVTANGLTLTGTNARDYAVAPTVSGAVGAIIPKTVTAGFNVVIRKVYDGTTTASIASASVAGKVAGDSLGVTGTANYASPNVGAAIVVTATNLALTGADAFNYVISSPTFSGRVGSITPKLLTASLTGPVQKAYDGTTAAILGVGNYSLTGFIAGDVVGLNDPLNGFYNSAVIGSGKTVTVSGVALTGAGASNYSLASSIISGAVGTIH